MPRLAAVHSKPTRRPSLVPSPSQTTETSSPATSVNRFDAITRTGRLQNVPQLSVLGDAFLPIPVLTRPLSIKRFACLDEAKEFAQSTKQEMQAWATEKIRRGEIVSDQDYPADVLVYDPPVAPTTPPLLILGGMGPLAGLEAFEEALKTSGSMKRVVLFQATQTPDRTNALLSSKQNPEQASHKRQCVVKALVQALNKGRCIASPSCGSVDVMVACNTAHAFIPEVLNQIDSTKIHWISFVDATVRSIEGNDKPTMIAGTTGTHLAGLYTRAFDNYKLTAITPNTEGQALLMQAIYDGIKGFNPEKALHFGELFVRNILNQTPKPKRILAACTEVPALIELLKVKGAQDVSEFLKECEILNPVEQAMRHLQSSQRSINLKKPLASLPLAA